MTEKCVVIITAKLKANASETNEYKEYSQRSNVNREAYGGVVLNSYKVTNNMGQGSTPHVAVIVEYPSKEKAVESFSNKEYQSIIPVRDQAFDEVNILFTS